MFNGFAYIREIVSLMGRHSNHVPILLSVGVIIGIVEIVGLGLVAQFMAGMFGISAGEKIPFLFDLGEHSFSNNFLGIVLVFIFLLRACLGILSYWYINHIAGKVEANLKSSLLLHYQHMPYEERIKRGESDLVNAINIWTTQYIRIVLTPLGRFASDALIAFIIFIFLGYTSPGSLVFLVFLIGTVGLLYDLTLRKYGQSYAKIFRFISTQLVSDVQQGLEGYREIRAFRLENFFYDRIKNSAITMCTALAKANTIAQSPRLIIEALVVLFVVVILYAVQLSGEETTKFLPVMAVFAVGGVRIVALASLASSVIFNLRLYRPIVKQLASDYALSAIDTPSESFLSKSNAFAKIDVNGVCFTYSGTKKPVLNNVSFTCVAGEHIAIIGPSGSGKTTLVDLLLGIVEPSAGSIKVSLRDDEMQKPNLIGIASYLSQTTFILNDSLRKNVALGCDGSEIDDARVITALNKAKLSQFADAQSLGMLLGDRGAKISGGQRQRVALARAFYLNKKVLILDEATNALDLQTEIEIINDLFELKTDITLITITHRPEIAKLFSRRLELFEGKIV